MLATKIQQKENTVSKNVIQEFSEALDAAVCTGRIATYEPDITSTLKSLQRLTKILQTEPDLYAYEREFNVIYSELRDKLKAREYRSIEDEKLEEFKENYQKKIDEELHLVRRPTVKAYIKSCVSNLLDASLQYYFSGSPLMSSPVALTRGIQGTAINLTQRQDLWSFTPLFSSIISCILGEGIRYACNDNPYMTILLATFSNNLVSRMETYLKIRREASQKQAKISEQEEEIKRNRILEDVALIKELIEQIKDANTKIAQFQSEHEQSNPECKGGCNTEAMPLKNGAPISDCNAPAKLDEIIRSMECHEENSSKQVERGTDETGFKKCPQVLTHCSFEQALKNPEQNSNFHSKKSSVALTNIHIPKEYTFTFRQHQADKILKKRKRCEIFSPNKMPKRNEQSDHPRRRHLLTFRSDAL